MGPPPCLWGNLPAIDLLNVNKNEGSEAISRQNVSLLFEASGDLRNVVKTIVGLPENYSGECKVAVNDANTTVIARNALLLLVTLFFRPEEAAPVMLHLWYSAMLPKSLTHGVRQRILPLVQRVCHRIKENPDNWMEEEVVEYGKASVCLVLKKSQWIALVAMLVPSENFTRLHGQAILRAVAEAKQDHIDRLLYKMPRARRAGAIHFRHSGVLLPFGASCVIFSEPNL